MNAFVAITDRDWFDFLAAPGDVDEVNFWQPSAGGGRFRALDRGEPFLFKLRTYDLRTEPGRSLWRAVADRLQATTPSPAAGEQLEMPGGWSDPVPTRRRMGQGTFQAVVLDAYGRQCAITSERAVPALDTRPGSGASSSARTASSAPCAGSATARCWVRPTSSLTATSARRSTSMTLRTWLPSRHEDIHRHAFGIRRQV